jgi:hypothetical protein
MTRLKSPLVIPKQSTPNNNKTQPKVNSGSAVVVEKDTKKTTATAKATTTTTTSTSTSTSSSSSSVTAALSPLQKRPTVVGGSIFDTLKRLSSTSGTVSKQEQEQEQEQEDKDHTKKRKNFFTSTKD